MATWTNVADANQLPGEPIRSIDIIAIKDNITAQAEGATGAPKQQTNGIENGAVTTPKIEDLNVTNAKVADGDISSDKFRTTATEDAWVRDRIANSFQGVVGTYAFLRNTSGTVLDPGDTITGLDLAYSNAGTTTSGVTVNGTWRCMGFSNGAGSAQESITLFVRIS